MKLPHFKDISGMKVFLSEKILTFVSVKKTLKDKLVMFCNTHNQ